MKLSDLAEALSKEEKAEKARAKRLKDKLEKEKKKSSWDKFMASAERLKDKIPFGNFEYFGSTWHSEDRTFAISFSGHGKSSLGKLTDDPAIAAKIASREQQHFLRQGESFIDSVKSIDNLVAFKIESSNVSAAGKSSDVSKQEFEAKTAKVEDLQLDKFLGKSHILVRFIIKLDDAMMAAAEAWYEGR